MFAARLPNLKPNAIVVVVGHQAGDVQAAVEAELGANGARFALQAEQRGTGDAVLAAENAVANSNSTVLILSGDVPMVRAETLRKLIDKHNHDRSSCTILTIKLENPTGYGRIVRDEADNFLRITEHRDATDEERKIREVNSGIYCFDTSKLFEALRQVKPANDQGEYYLTDVAAILKSAGESVGLYLHPDSREVSGVNTRAELAEFENLLRRSTVRRLMLEAGVTFIDPSHTYISRSGENRARLCDSA
jgi:bifunctional UDP-N-acetylglucosamine pyrophosphorylase/glucosamine-1-phosphate N-acetyltransferase